MKECAYYAYHVINQMSCPLPPNRNLFKFLVFIVLLCLRSLNHWAHCCHFLLIFLILIYSNSCPAPPPPPQRPSFESYISRRRSCVIAQQLGLLLFPQASFLVTPEYHPRILFATSTPSLTFVALSTYGLPFPDCSALSKPLSFLRHLTVDTHWRPTIVLSSFSL